MSGTRELEIEGSTRIESSPHLAPAPAPRRLARLPWMPGAVAVVAVLFALELVSRTGLVPSRYFPPVTEILGRLFSEVLGAEFWVQIGQTLQGWAIGLAIAVVVGVPAGLAIGWFWWLYRPLRPVIEFLRPVPSVALIPLAVLVYGTGLETKVFLVAFAAMWPMLLQALYGTRGIDALALETARSYRLRPTDVVVKVMLPSVLPFLATGLRISSSVALVLAVTAELVVGAPGIGRGITMAEAGGDAEMMYALIALTGLLGWALNALLGMLERHLLRWHASQSTEGVAS